MGQPVDAAILANSAKAVQRAAAGMAKLPDGRASPACCRRAAVRGATVSGVARRDLRQAGRGPRA
eukprot:3667759-Lingulodinium_polyedra.AAC.1